MNFNEKNILVTGASGGMGMAACQKLSDAGMTIYGIDIRQPDREVSWNFFQADITDSRSVQDVIDALKEKQVKIDVVIHHAGVYELNSLVEMTDEEILRVFNINFFSMVRLNRELLPLLNLGAKIIITSSELAPLDPLPFTGIYGITKSTVEKYAFSLRMEVQLLGIKVIVIRPGAVKTGLLDVSTQRLEAFVKNTRHYNCNAARFKRIVDSVENTNIAADKIADLDLKIIASHNPKYIYSINRNILLRLLNILPGRLQTFIIRMILGS